MSGVATSCDLKKNSPYITINFSKENNTRGGLRDSEEKELTVLPI